MNNEQHDNMDKFFRIFGADPDAHTADAYNTYIKGAEKVWMLYSEKYEMKARSAVNARKGSNRGVELYENGSHLLGIAIELKGSTLYVHDSALRAKLKLDYNQDSRGQYRCTMSNIDEVLGVLKGVI